MPAQEALMHGVTSPNPPKENFLRTLLYTSYYQNLTIKCKWTKFFIIKYKFEENKCFLIFISIWENKVVIFFWDCDLTKEILT